MVLHFSYSFEQNITFTLCCKFLSTSNNKKITSLLMAISSKKSYIQWLLWFHTAVCFTPRFPHITLHIIYNNKKLTYVYYAHTSVRNKKILKLKHFTNTLQTHLISFIFSCGQPKTSRNVIPRTSEYSFGLIIRWTTLNSIRTLCQCHSLHPWMQRWINQRVDNVGFNRNVMSGWKVFHRTLDTR